MENLRESSFQKFQKEIAELKPNLPKDYKAKFFKMHPEYDSYRGGVLLQNVIAGRSSDILILDALKQIVKQQTL
jgi:hypothetical protein